MCEATDRKESCEDLGELGAMREESRSAMVNSLPLSVFLGGIISSAVYTYRVGVVRKVEESKECESVCEDCSDW